MEEGLNWGAVPVWLLAGWLIYELAALPLRRCTRQVTWHAWLKLVGWGLRPWAAWAAVNAVHRWQFHRRITSPSCFPFYANLWRPEGSIRSAFAQIFEAPELLGWTAVVGGLGMLLTVVAISILRRQRYSKRWVIGVLLLIYLLAILLHLSLAAVPGGCLRAESRFDSYLKPWFNSGAKARWP